MNRLLDNIKPFFNKNKKDIDITITEQTIVDRPIEVDSFLISQTYINVINECFKNNEVITYNNGRNTIIINLFTTQDIEHNIWNNTDYNILDLNVIMMLSIMDYIKITDNKVIVYFYPTKFKKEWNGRSLTPEVINSGFTSHGKNKYILIYRKEEYNRLLLHELIHYLLLDNAMNYEIWKSTHMQISLDYNIFNHINLFETYTDTWAILLLIIMTNIIDPTLSLTYLLNKEKEHILCMVQQLLYQLSIPDLGSISIHRWVQQTSALSYYVFKYGTLNMKDFIEKYPLGIKLNKKLVNELYHDIRRELNRKVIVMMNCSKSAKLSYLGYDV